VKIKTKLFLALAITAFVSVLLATFFSIYSVSENYEEIARDATVNSRKKAENIYYEYLGDLTRKAAFISELKEVIENMDNADALSFSLENKGFFLFNINTKILNPDMDIVVCYANSSTDTLSKDELKKLPFFQPGRDALLRDIGIFKTDDQICILAVSPIVDQADFSFKGYVVFEHFLNAEFADQLKDKAGCDIIILSKGKELATSFQNDEGRRFFPKFSQDLVRNKQKKKILNENYLIDEFPIFNYQKQQIGSIFVAVNVKNILIAKSQGIRNILIVLVITSLLVIATSLVVGRKLSQPVLALSNSAQAIAKGDFDVQIEPTSKDEIGDLSKTFANMAKSLRIQREEILDLKAFFEKIINNSPSALIICDESGEVISFNPAAEKILDTRFSNIKGKNIFDTFQFSSSIKADFYNVMLSGHPTYHDPYPQYLPSEEEKIFRLTLYKIVLKKGNSVAIQIEDITERLQMEEDLTHAQKLGTIGEVLSRFTHEFNNLMTGIMGHISLLKQKTDKDSPSLSRIMYIEELATKATQLGSNILDFSRKKKPETKRISVTELADSVLNLIGKTVLKGLIVEKNYKEDCLFVIGNKEKLSMVLFNLLINAKDAIAEAKVPQGKITVEVDSHDTPGRKYVKLNIRDNGIGIDKKNLDKVFLPFFSTKGKKGTGIGLSTVKKVIESYNGDISISSQAGVGTTFTILLPEANDEVD